MKSPPLEKGDLGGFVFDCGDQIPPAPPFSKGGKQRKAGCADFSQHCSYASPWLAARSVPTTDARRWSLRSHGASPKKKRKTWSTPPGGNSSMTRCSAS